MPKGAVRGVVMLLITVAIFAAAWLSWPDGDAPFATASDTVGGGGAAPAAPMRAATDREPVSMPDATAPGTGLPHAAGPSSTDRTLRVRLRGLHPLAPWTTALHLDLEGRDANDEPLAHEAAVTPGDDGLATFALPAWCATATRQEGRLRARDPNYQPVLQHWDGAIDTDLELVLDVQVVAMLTGRVVEATNQPVPAVRVSAFPMHGDTLDAIAASTSTDAKGEYRLRVPPDVPLLLVAVAMHEASAAHLATLSEDGPLDSGDPRSELLPASTPALAHVNTATQVADLVLIAPANVTGTVRWPDGTPAELATVLGKPHGGTALRIDEMCSVHRLADGRIAPAMSVDTDSDGAFELPGVPGVVVDVRITELPEAVLLGDDEPRPATPPQHLELFLPPLVALRAVAGDKPVPHARIELANGRHFETGADGSLQVLAANAFRVRASREQRRSPWLDVVPAAAGAEIRLLLTDSLQPVSIEFEGDARVRNIVIAWRGDDRREGREHLLRDDRSGPFRIFLESGHYHLVAGPGDGDRDGVYLLPVEREIDVTTAPVALQVPAVFGGAFVVQATDARGLGVAGTCRVAGNDGVDRTATFHRADGGRDAARGRPGELLACPSEFDGLLPPGTYELQFTFPEYGTRIETVTIRPRAIADVRLRLP